MLFYCKFHRTKTYEQINLTAKEFFAAMLQEESASGEDETFTYSYSAPMDEWGDELWKDILPIENFMVRLVFTFYNSVCEAVQLLYESFAST